MNLLKQIEEDLKAALKSHNEVVVSTLRFLLAAIKNFQIEKQRDLSDEEIVQIIQRQVKQGRESIAAFELGKRSDLVLKEREEINILSKYLPQQLNKEELEKIVRETIAELKPTREDFGKVMGQVMAKVKGRAEGGLVSQIVKEAFGI